MLLMNYAIKIIICGIACHLTPHVIGLFTLYRKHVATTATKPMMIEVLSLKIVNANYSVKQLYENN